MASTTGTLKPKIPFAEVKASKVIMHEAQLLLVREIAGQSSRFVSENNTQMFYHGRAWTYQREGRDGFTPQSGLLELHQEKLTVGIDRLLANDVTVLPDLILGFGEQVSSHQAKSVANELNAVVEETGNTIAVPKDGSMADAFLESLKRCVWSVDSKRNVRPPHILLDAESQKFELNRRPIHRPIGMGSILSSHQAASVSGFGNLRKSESGRKPMKSRMLGKKPQIAPPPGTWIRPGSEKSFWSLSSGSRGRGPTLQLSRNGSSVGFGLRRAPWPRAQ